MAISERLLNLMIWGAEVVWKCLPEKARESRMGGKLKLLRLPKRRVRMWGKSPSRNLYLKFTSPHPRLKVIPFKALGVALLEMPDSFEAYISNSRRQYLRRSLRKAEKAHFRPLIGVDLLLRLNEVMAIHGSVEVRQRRPIDSEYLDEEKVRAFILNSSVEQARNYGVEDEQGHLVAYLTVNLLGEGWCTGRIMGHGNALSYGVMYMLIAEAVKDLIELKTLTGFPRYGMYDTYLAGSDGMRTFKHNCGFEPYLVEWQWLDKAPYDGGLQTDNRDVRRELNHVSKSSTGRAGDFGM